MRVVRHRRTRSARGRLQKLVGKARKGFFDSLRASPSGGALFCVGIGKLESNPLKSNMALQHKAVHHLRAGDDGRPTQGKGPEAWEVRASSVYAERRLAQSRPHRHRQRRWNRTYIGCLFRRQTHRAEMRTQCRQPPWQVCRFRLPLWLRLGQAFSGSRVEEMEIFGA